jgi:hypothetical protein
MPRPNKSQAVVTIFRSWPKIAAMRWLIPVSLVIALAIVILHAADVHRPEGLNLVGLDRGADRAYTPQRMRVEVVDFCGRVVEVPIAVRGDNVAFGLGYVEVAIPARNYNAFTFYLWRLDKQVAHASVSMTPDGGVFVRVGGRMGGEYELHGDVLIIRLYKDGLTYKHVLLIAPVVIVVVATIIGLVMMANGRYGGGADPHDALSAQRLRRRRKELARSDLGFARIVVQALAALLIPARIGGSLVLTGNSRLFNKYVEEVSACPEAVKQVAEIDR